MPVKKIYSYLNRRGEDTAGRDTQQGKAQCGETKTRTGIAAFGRRFY